ncbi:MAG TPA: adenylosuccinate synthase [Pirellulaceae bacterium]|nr:adenylosuccinate synthase [Pirellulaceae bacterium]
MSGISVIGLQWGDEAKGKLVDLLTERHEIVVRYQGGANAGHTVVVGDQVYKLHHIPSGILNESAINVVAAGVVIHPETILREIDALTSRGIRLEGRLLLSDRAHVVMPWHIIEDQLWHNASPGEDNIGTTLRGIGPCYRDKVGRSHAIRLGDLDQPDFTHRLHQIAQLKLSLLQSLPGANRIELDVPSIENAFQGYATRLRPFIADTTNYLLDAVEADKKILFEGAQGSLLDIDHGTFPFVTSSNSSGVGVSAGSGVPARWINRVIGVAKAYSTRVGGGPFPTELHDALGEHIRVKGKEFGTTTGRPRRCGWLDAVAVRYTRRLGGVHAMALMMLDVLSELPELKICVGYELDGRPLTAFPSRSEHLRRVRPVYETLAGWQCDITRARHPSDLPPAAREYIRRIEYHVGCSIETVSVGPDRLQTIAMNTG